ncbi:hypothetical protein AES38_15155 (plasmid) [Clavibacter capsici]|nr:hypothetical protein AES38_15155 [Clavibacter capsici]
MMPVMLIQPTPLQLGIAVGVLDTALMLHATLNTELLPPDHAMQLCLRKGAIKLCHSTTNTRMPAGHW